jgi:hypothetical protein
MTSSQADGLNSFLLSWLNYHDVLREYSEATLDKHDNYSTIQIPSTDDVDRKVSLFNKTAV